MLLEKIVKNLPCKENQTYGQEMTQTNIWISSAKNSVLLEIRT